MSKETSPTLSISLTVKKAAEALAFYTKALGAEEMYRMPTPDGGVAHAEFMLGNSRVFVSDEAPDWHALAMPEGTMASCLFAIVTDDCDGSFRRAVEAGAIPLSEPQDQFWGRRAAMIKDPFGYRWSFSQLIEELTPEEIERRAKKSFGSETGTKGVEA